MEAADKDMAEKAAFFVQTLHVEGKQRVWGRR